MDFTARRLSIHKYYGLSEAEIETALAKAEVRDNGHLRACEELAQRICQSTRLQTEKPSPLQRLLQEFDLSTQEGVALLALAEALLRIPDTKVATRLIADRIRPIDWSAHIHAHQSVLINTSSALLLLSKAVLQDSSTEEHDLHRMLRKLGEPIIHRAMKRSIESIGKHFVLAQDLDQACSLIQSAKDIDRFSIDMLGEAAVCDADAQQYFQRYRAAIENIANTGLQGRSSISVKLSALHPRLEAKRHRFCVPELLNRLTPLIELAATHGITITIDAEEAVRLDLTLDALTQVLTTTEPHAFPPVGLAVQAYSPRAIHTLQYLLEVAQSSDRQIPVRLVKGAYWDTEIKQAQIDGLKHYPVFTYKQQTDANYLLCADFLLTHRRHLFPQFATHNSITIADILLRHPPDGSYEFQRLQGMGENTYKAFREQYPDLPVRIYAPVGAHHELLPYLIRRMLENGANNAFVRQSQAPDTDFASLCRHPLRNDPEHKPATDQVQPAVPLPEQLYTPFRRNSLGLNLGDPNETAALQAKISELSERFWECTEIFHDKHDLGELVDCSGPCDPKPIGRCYRDSPNDVQQKLKLAYSAQDTWQSRAPEERAQVLESFAGQLHKHRMECISLLVREAGKTLVDACNEVREAIDFAHYYAQQAREKLTQATRLPGPSGEENHLRWRARGVFLCISPWNFPLAIFSGQISAALVSGNTVLAKPASSTPLIASFTCQLFHQAGLPQQALQLICGDGAKLCAPLCESPMLAGITFTGSTATAHALHQYLGKRNHDLIPLIAETGGQNAMLVDSSCLPEQVVRDVITSAFHSAGQRCSALRVLYLQDEIYDRVVALLCQACDEERIGDPSDLATDIGPLISHGAHTELENHIVSMRAQGRLIHQSPLPEKLATLPFMPPTIIQLDSISELKQEHFGPILHLIRFDYAQTNAVIDDINRSGYGLTFGIHSRNEVWAKQIAQRIKAGNVYINRNMVGAIVASQPFGGRGLSGTGPKAGGPHYLDAFMTEQSLCNNLSAIGGNVELITQAEDGRNRQAPD